MGKGAVTEFEALSESEAIDFLFSFDRTFEGQLDEERHQDVLESLRAMKEIQLHNGEAGCHRYILSNCSGAYHIAVLHAMAKASGWEGALTMDLVPLFESIQDLDGARAEMAKLYTHPVYASHLDQRHGDQTVMLGFSDGTKDGGYLRANWAIYRAKQRLTDVSRAHGRTVMFFDGRGGPRTGRRQHPPLLRVAGPRHREPRNPNHDPGPDDFLQLWHSEVGGLQPRTVHGGREEPPVRRGGDAHPARGRGAARRAWRHLARALPRARNRPEFTDYLATFGTPSSITGKPTSAAAQLHAPKTAPSTSKTCAPSRLSVLGRS